MKVRQGSMRPHSHWRIPTLSLAVGVALAAATLATPAPAAAKPKITLPLVQGLYNGESVWYISTEASDAGLATATGATYAPKLSTAIGVGATADLFHVTNFDQPNVLDSVPSPVGPGNTDPDYSPLWRIHLVTWRVGVKPVLLTSEQAVLDAEAAGNVTIEATSIVVNCPVIATPSGHLPSALEVEIEADGEATVTLPLVKGFVNGATVFYINTEASDAGVAAHDGTNFAPKLVHAHASGAEDDIFPFFGSANPAQHNILGSAPNPVGPANTDFDYSPLWDVVPVQFVNQTVRHYPLVRSEPDLLALQARGVLTVGPEAVIIVNCPVLRVAER
ncbi:MAG: hypothetical protein HY207_09430 [Nitrospirae bacterium]|nr:hypothetical protein [Nitrospirota bacterium]